MILDAIKLGIEQFDKISNNLELNKALKQRLVREIKFNIEILNKIIEKTKIKNQEKIKNLILLLQTDFYDYLNDSLINIDKIIKSKAIDISQQINNYTIRNKNFLSWSKELHSNHDILERVYHRLKIAKSLSSIDNIQNIQSYKYIHFLLLLLRDSLNE